MQLVTFFLFQHILTSNFFFSITKHKNTFYENLPELEVHKIFITRGSLVFNLTETCYQPVHYQLELLTRRSKQLANLLR
jgi:hypothetical protein